jgi:NDP-sugar pyrophosphorylase family protein
VRTSETIAAAEGTTAWTVGRNARIAPSARVTRSIVWDDVTIGEGASLDGCVVTDGVTIPPGASYARSAIVATTDGLLISPVEPK